MPRDHILNAGIVFIEALARVRATLESAYPGPPNGRFRLRRLWIEHAVPVEGRRGVEVSITWTTHSAETLLSL